MLPQSFVEEVCDCLRHEDLTRLKREILDYTLEPNDICNIFRALRCTMGGEPTCFPREAIPRVLQILTESISLDCPSHVSFAGHKDSFLQLPSVSLDCRNAYTLSLWLNIDSDSPSRGFLLFRCRSPTGGIDAMVTDRQNSKWLITLRSFVGNSAEKDETRNLFVTLNPGCWHLISIHHSAPSSILSNAKVSVFVDGVRISRECDGDEFNSAVPLVYPFNASPVESQWKFAVGFKGKISSCAFYPEYLASQQVLFLHNLGPNVPTLASGLTFPQASFDSGYTQLGTIYAKTTPIQPTFAWTVYNLLPNACLPYVGTGKLNLEHIDMTPAQIPKLLIPILHGPDSRIVSDINCLERWGASGGIYLPLYLLWDFCKGEEHINAIEAVMSLLGKMIEMSSEFKEQFLQIHGFHIVSYCLMKLPVTFRNDDYKLLKQCLNLAHALGNDSTIGDGVASALQGLLLDFRLWKDCSLSVRLLLLDSVAELVLTCKEQMFKAIGVQSVLDIMRLYVCIDSNVSDKDRQFLLSCANSGLQLLKFAVESAIVAKESKRSCQEPELLLLCLDECTNCILAEKILQLLVELRVLHSTAILKAMQEHRFADTTVIRFLTSKGYSLVVRKLSLILLLWSFGESVRNIEIIQLRNARMIANEILNHERKPPFSRIPPDARDTEIERLKQAKLILRPFERIWMTMSMLSESIDGAIHSGAWEIGSFSLPDYNDIVCILAHDGPLGTVSPWIVLPLLSPLLNAPQCSLELCQRVLMSVNVSLKMDEIQCELMGILGDRTWCRHLVNLACMGEKYRHIATAISDVGIAETCSELAIDAISTVLEQKTRYQGYNSGNLWKCVQEVITVTCSPLEDGTELKFLKKCVSFVLQRFARRTESWNADYISSIVNILAVVENRKLCGQVKHVEAPIRAQTSDEQQILCFMFDVMASLRKAAVGGVLDGMERRALKPANRILLGCMHFTTDEIADRVCMEVISGIQFNSEPWGAPTEKYFRDYVSNIFAQLNVVTNYPFLDENVRDRYCALVYHIMHHFIDLRHNLAIKGTVAPHVISTLDSLSGIDTQKDCSIIFQMLAIKFDFPQAYAVNSFEGQPKNDYNLVSTVANSISMPVEEISDSDMKTLSSGEGELLAAELKVETEFEDEQIPTTVNGKHSQSDQLASWLKVRHGIVSERADAERTRIIRFEKTLDVSLAASARHWAKLQRKIAMEYFYESPPCEWKLGVSHEGPFPGRKRIVLRPRYQSKFVESEKPKKTNEGGEVIDVLQVGRELARAYRSTTESYSGDIHDNRVSEEAVLLEDETPPIEDAVSEVEWGLDGDGIIEEDRSTIQNSLPIQSIQSQVAASDGDFLGDVKHMDEKHFQGRGTETGPAHPGTRKLSSASVKVTFEARVMLVTASGNTWGSLSFNGREIFFASVSDVGRSDEGTDSASVTLSSVPRIRRRRWALSSVSAIYLRRYRLRNSALEVFFRRGKHRNFFCDFGHTEEAEKAKNDFARALMSAAPKSAFLQWPTISNFSLVRLHGVQAKWLNGEISNFDYLMALNTISGRTFNDLCQYPVMPWVISQYTETTLDLQNSANYRDLSKPMGALNGDRLREFLDRYESFEENGTTDMPAFMYGSHYSTMVGVVLHFLVRVQPFADLHREMQGGHFDVADRLFSSIPRTWDQNTTQLSEVKEITPEWFTTPEIFKNVNNFALGKTQDGETIADVVLPSWAKSAEEFVQLNREALESDYVSEHIHEWIDLIFGFKQLLPHSEKAYNVFFYLTYADLVDWKKLNQDDAMRLSTELQISHFGQTPMQLFNSSHPKKGSIRLFNASFVPRPLRKCFVETAICRRFALPTTVDEVVSVNAKVIMFRRSNELVGGPAIAISFIASRIVCIFEGGGVDVLKFGLPEDVKNAISTAITKSKGRRGSDFFDIDRMILFDGSPSISIEKEKDIFFPDPVLFFDRESPSSSEIVTRIPAAINLPKERLNRVLIVSQSGRYALAGGKPDGSIMVREIDRKFGFFKTEGDFKAHRFPVLHIASDTIPTATTEAVASCDAAGLVYVWTVSEIRHQLGNLKDFIERESVISRRPQRLFRCRPCPDICCDISCKMGVVVVCCGADIHLFSIERDERLRLFRPSGPDNFGFESRTLSKRVIRRVTLCNDGIIVLYVEVSFEPLHGGTEDITLNFLENYTLGGSSIDNSRMTSQVTFLQCPGRADVVVTGHKDGNVSFYRSQNLNFLFTFTPHTSCVLANPASWNAARQSDLSPSPVIFVKVGPNGERPALLIVSTESGNIYLRPLPDFIRWEKESNPSAFSQLVSAPLEAVRGTIQQAHTLGTQLQANAQTIAANASRLADDAVSELKRFFGKR